MANTFKNSAFANVASYATETYSTLYTAPTNTRTIILGLALANKSASAVTVKVQFSDYSAGTSYQMLEDVSIPANTTLEVLAGQKYVLETSDALKIMCSAENSVDAIMGLMEIA